MALILVFVATLAAGLFAGAALYVTAVEHPARVSCGTEVALREFGPSYQRGAIMQASLAVTGALAGFGAAWQRQDLWMVVAALLLGSVVPFTLLVIFPTNARLLDPALDPRGPDAPRHLARWGRLHAVRTVLSLASFLILLVRIMVV